MPWLINHNFRLRYKEDGQNNAPVVVLLHEMGLCLEAWDYLVTLIAHKYRVLRLDLRGMGLSQGLLEAPQMSDFSDDVRELLDHCEINEPVLLVGAALGGAIALAFTAAYPERTKAIIAASPALGVNADKKAQTLQMADNIERNGFGYFLNDDALETLFPTKLRSPQERYQQFLEISHAADCRSIANIYRMNANLDLTEQLAQVRRPALFLGGEHDLIRPVEVVKKSAELVPGSRYMSISSGHYVSLQAPKTISQLIDLEHSETIVRA